ncbi:MAG: dNTP triphosphohydrolase [Bacilli bacterium]|nr:dNTP triphosphohydrolase [Bacilli bacterium]
MNTIPSILKSAALIHDLGNPPFGHIGESIISDWFKNNIKNIYIKKTIDSGFLKINDTNSNSSTANYNPIEKFLDPQLKHDLLSFEGNAQLLRILSRLSSKKSEGCSAALIGACMKYTRPSYPLPTKTNKNLIENKKLGYFFSERYLVSSLQTITGSGTSRNPLAFLLEAADDISYVTSDIEDAIKKGLVDFSSDIYGWIKTQIPMLSGAELAFFSNIYTAISSKPPLSKEKQIKNFISVSKNEMIDACVDVFLKNEINILNGNFSVELLEKSVAQKLVEHLRKLLEKKVYLCREIASQKAMVFKILNTLLDAYVPASFLCAKTSSTKKDTKSQVICELFSENYKKHCIERINKINSSNVLTKRDKMGYKIYACMQLAIDEISGMTDLYAYHMYDIINATKKPV